MGDQIGVAVGGTLYYVPYKECQRVLGLPIDAVTKTALFATLCRINTLYMIAGAGSGHIGSSFSSMEIMAWLHCNELRAAPAADPQAPQDIFFSSKGHDAPALYSALLATGKLDFELIHRLRRLGGLPGHPDVATSGIITNTGSLGMGVSKAKGMIFANRLRGRAGNVFVLTGDGELQEGQFWESLLSAANHGLEELTIIVDHNKLQSDTLVSKVSDLGDLAAKLIAFGWQVFRCDGNDLTAFSATLAASKQVQGAPKAIIADTVKGKGVSFMEHTAMDSDVELYKFHSGAPSEDAYVKAVQELIDTAASQLRACGAAALSLQSVTRPSASPSNQMQRLIPAYSQALLDQARKHARLVALDADLVLDTGLLPFKHEFPARFVECGIAEQDMVSQAGGMALQGVLPVVHSFACFLSARANEQIYNNATERTRIIYVGSLAGVVPGGPGHSHQAIRDIASLGAIPGLVMLEPSCDAEVAPLFSWCVNEAPASSYLRLVSIPLQIPYALPANYQARLGCGITLVEGVDAVVVAYGPVLLSSAVQAAQLMQDRTGLKIKVVNLPWLNYIDPQWLANELSGYRHVIALDNHYLIGGQGDRIAAAIATGGLRNTRLHRIGMSDVPACGSNAEVLAAHGLDADGLVSKLQSVLCV